MKVLLADPDRDVLSSYGRLLEICGHEVTQCFEGTQCMEKISSVPFDSAIIGSSIPRVPCDSIIDALSELKIPTVCLISRKISSRLLLGRVLACSYLSYPFLPEELLIKLDAVYAKRHSDEVLTAGNVSVSVSDFTIDGAEIRLTSEEIDVFKALLSANKPPEKNLSTYINTLNQKFRNGKKNLAIEYKFTGDKR